VSQPGNGVASLFEDRTDILSELPIRPHHCYLQELLPSCAVTNSSEAEDS
jgi:hypothetical protein